ncbi:hypothetical protein [Roseomonas sp. HF4]|uniref:hypothetical protein n=1 Tax=Roseomonas sp. HF4 TaxID=2562313 RepID=UPI0010BF9227|nr:hypothetical protein [Roseomonas sp. HF4]
MVAVTSCAQAGPVLSPAAWCDGFERGRLGIAGRMEGVNLVRLRAAEARVAPSIAGTRAVSGVSLLGGYQEELERTRPDTGTAAIFLATASAVSVTYDLVAEVNGLLCVSTSTAQARRIAAAAADAQREMLAEARR